ncbi:hypothetical protein Q0812_08415 [Brevundimonas sp. 2R-24]|uniref:Uncharacterized protein n=1 Tax=Peiella sedimenti TaxID=3061083 RepID=A0ABT8SLT8_9CAUL|nr:hypothetical protein [Caulobacteraceae bacterium XZ-24]
MSGRTRIIIELPLEAQDQSQAEVVRKAEAILALVQAEYGPARLRLAGLRPPRRPRSPAAAPESYVHYTGRMHEYLD